jgi:hypothetical protein
VLVGGMGIVLIGVAAGLAGTLWATNLLRLLFNVDSHDPLIYTAVVHGVFGVALLANVAPARRAAAVDPRLTP